MRRAFVSGVGAACRYWPVVLMLFAAGVAAAVTFGAAAWCWLSVALGRSLATRTLLTDLDAQIFIDLVAYHSEGFALLLTTGLVLAGCCWLLGVWLNAVTVAAVAREMAWWQSPLEGCRAFPTYLCLCAVINLAQAAVIVGLLFGGRAVIRWTADSATEMAFYWISGTAVLLGGAVVFFLATVHDHARVRAAKTGASALAALRWALRYVGYQDGRALLLAIILLVTSLLVWLFYQTVSGIIRTDTAFGVTLSLVWGEALLLSRAFLRVWWFASASHMQSAAERAAHWRQPSEHAVT
jgi:hypothetical protein